jgi:DNA-directed RNA polymerase specialized sigma24 family protein
VIENFQLYIRLFYEKPDDAEDIVQDVFERLLEFHSKIRKHTLASFEACVIKMTKNACIDFLRTQKYMEPNTFEKRRSGIFLNSAQEESFVSLFLFSCVISIGKLW